MQIDTSGFLRRLGAGEGLASVCRAPFVREVFDRWWKQTIESRLLPRREEQIAGLHGAVDIRRDDLGIPHIFAQHEDDLVFGLGYAMAQDRLFQLDYLRRKGLGRLSEILGAEGLELDTIARTVGLNRIAAAEWETLTSDVRRVLEAFSAGVNAVIDGCGDRWPIEFGLLDYRPERWTPIDCLAIESEFRWYLTGRFPVIVIPELAKRTLGRGRLYDEFVLGEADDEPILWPGEYATSRAGGRAAALESVGHAVNDPEAAVGSNNWVVSGQRTTTGAPLLASDPHIAFEAVSCWYQAHLCGAGVNVAGMSYVGMPAILFGRTERVAWGITNNICSLRDLYQERTDAAHPNCFLFDGAWEPAHETVEVIRVRNAEPVVKTIRFSRNGPVVDEILPAAARGTGPVTLKWLGAHHGGWLTSLLGMNRAANVDELRQAVRPWHVPLFSLVIADVEGHIAYQAAGRIPVRRTAERGYRPGWDPEHQWQGLIPFEEMPHVVDPERGWVATANNRVAAADFPFPLSGCWSSGWRAVRIRQLIESRERISPDDMREMQQDSRSLRAADLIPALAAVLKPLDSPLGREALGCLEAWDCHVEPDSVAATIFNVFITHWCSAVSHERFGSDIAEFMSGAAAGCAGRLLKSDDAGWFARGDRELRIRGTFGQTLNYLSDRFGAELSQWTWSKLHRMPLKHVLSSRGDLGTLLNHGDVPVRGDMLTVCNTGCGADWSATTGAGYRLIADLSLSPPVLFAIDAQSQSGQPGSPHYDDQLSAWMAGDYHQLPLNRDGA